MLGEEMDDILPAPKAWALWAKRSSVRQARNTKLRNATDMTIDVPYEASNKEVQSKD
jgi:hypothetical protein